MGSSFWRLFGAYAINTVGDEFYALALPLVLLASGYPGASVTFLFGVLTASTVAAGFVVGYLVDRYPPRGVLTTSYLASAAILFLGVGAVAAGADGYAVALAGAAILGVFAALSAAAVDAGIPRTVAREDQASRGYSLVESARTAALIFGPACAGLVTLISNLLWVLSANAGSFLLAAAISHTRGTAARHRRAPGEPVFAMIRDGLRAVLRNRALGIGIGLSLIANITLGAEQPLFLTRFVRDFGVSGMLTSAVVIAAGLSAIATSLVLTHLARRLTARTAMIWSCVASALAAAGIGLTTNPPLAAALYCVLCASTISYNVYWRTYRQQVVPAGLLGRVSATCRSLAYSGIVLGTTVVGAFQQAGATTGLLFTAGGFACLTGMLVGAILSRPLSSAKRRVRDDHAESPPSPGDPRPEQPRHR
ncbi:MFS transporter [Amycolatopsis sp. cg13]|uniref:MFS transporter n=1 Tax=Amycolatopsis sp. cg13 TaxID=3238807 RepID=UPI003525B6C7